MKKTILFALAACMIGFASCSNDEVVNTSSEGVLDGRMTFNVTNDAAKGTRANPINIATWWKQMQSFQVWSYLTPDATGTGVTPGARYVGTSETAGIQIDNQNPSASDLSSVTWDYNKPLEVQYWPATTAKLNFHAISPVSDASFTVSSSVDAGNKPKLTATVTVPTDETKQCDIMVAQANEYTRETNAQKVDFTFKHALSKIDFAARLFSEKIDVAVNSITMCNIGSTGTAGIENFTVFANSDRSTVANYSVDVTTYHPAHLTAANASQATGSGKAVYLTGDKANVQDGSLIMLPQTSTKWATVPGTPVSIAVADAQKQTYLKVNCKIVDTTSGVVLVNDEDIYLPFEANWATGSRYVYTLVFGKGAGGYDEDGNPIDELLPITYVVTAVTDWNTVIDIDTTEGLINL